MLPLIAKKLADYIAVFVKKLFSVNDTVKIIKAASSIIFKQKHM